MSLRNIGIVYRKELIDSLRDRRTVISMVAVPLLLMPLLTIGMGVLSAKLVGQAMEEVPKVMILGGEDSPNVSAELDQLKDVQIVPAKPDYAEEISNKQIRAAVEIPARLRRQACRRRAHDGEDLHVRGRAEIGLRRGPAAKILSGPARPDHPRTSPRRGSFPKAWCGRSTSSSRMWRRRKKWAARSWADSFPTSSSCCA